MTLICEVRPLCAYNRTVVVRGLIVFTLTCAGCCAPSASQDQVPPAHVTDRIETDLKNLEAKLESEWDIYRNEYHKASYADRLALYDRRPTVGPIVGKGELSDA